MTIALNTGMTERLAAHEKRAWMLRATLGSK